MTELKRREHFLSDLTRKIFADAEENYNKHGKRNCTSQHKLIAIISDEIYQSLHAVYGIILERALEFLDACKVVEYRSKGHTRNLYALESTKEHYILFDSINFCWCDTFKCQVLEGGDLMMCEHVLALCLAQITKRTRSEELTEQQFVELLNSQIPNDCEAN